MSKAETICIIIPTVVITKTVPDISSETDTSDHTSLSDQVYEYLVDRIISGEISYGAKLNIKKIAMQLEVSTMPIRDAIKRLEQENVVVVKPRSNCYVRMPSKRSTLDAIDARRMVEMFAIQQVYPRVTKDELVPLEEILSDMGDIAESPTECKKPVRLREYIDLDRRFHTELCELSQNEYVRRFYRATSLHLNMSFSYGVGMCHGVTSTYAEHRQIVDHLRVNSAQAATVLEQHLLRSRSNIVREPTFQALPDYPRS